MSTGGKMIESKNYMRSRSRTKVRNEFNFRTSFSGGYLFPIYAREIYPSMGDAIDCAELVRSITPLGPTMDNSFLDIYFFFVPNRLVWDHWEEFIAGYNKEAWAQDVEYSVPQINFKHITSTEDDPYVPADHVDDYLHSFMDYLPFSCNVTELPYMQLNLTEAKLNELNSISALYPRAYAKIWNDWFRDENVQDELEIYTGDNDEYADEFCFDLLDPTKLLKACKLHDRFTSALPAPVKGPDVLIPMNNLPVTIETSLGITSGSSYFAAIGNTGVSSIPAGTKVPVVERISSSPLALGNAAYANNVSNTIRMLRLATQTELLLARDARGGTRYTESILSHFGVHNGDARLQRSEYLGSRSIPLNVQQVTNTTQSDGSALGNVGGQSVTKDSSFYFSKDFPEWGIILGVAVVRTNLSYSSGIHKQYQRKGRFDFIWPEFKHLGDVPLYTKEIFVSDDVAADDVFGYTPYGSELRTGLNYNNGLFRPNATGSLAYLTYQEDYPTMPILSDGYIKQDEAVIANTLTVQTGPQFYALFKITEQLIIPLDPTSDPGLMDHF